MKKLLKRVLLLSAMLVMVMSIHALAATTYDQKVNFQFGRGINTTSWSDTPFILPANTTISVSITLDNTNSGVPVGTITRNMTYYLKQADGNTTVNLSGINYNSATYTLSGTVVTKGKYAFIAEYNPSQIATIPFFKLSYTLTGDDGTNLPSELYVAQGTQLTIPVSDTYPVTNCSSSNNNICTVTADNTALPSTITVYGSYHYQGSATVYVTVNGVTKSAIVYVGSTANAPKLYYDNLDLSVGDTSRNHVVNAVSTVTWSSSNTSVATVDANGVIKAVAVGECNIFATTTYNGTKYKLACKVSVGKVTPEFSARVSKVKRAKRKVYLWVKNYSDEPMTIYRSGGRLLDIKTYATVRKLRLQDYSTYKLDPGKQKRFVFYIKGSKIPYGTKYDFALRFKFKLGGRTYIARAYADSYLSEYILKSNLSKDTWLHAYSAGT